MIVCVVFFFLAPIQPVLLAAFCTLHESTSIAVIKCDLLAFVIIFTVR